MELDEQIARDTDVGSASPSHPEEMRAQVQLHVGDRAVLTATARATPAGLVSVGATVAAILLSAAALVRAARRSRRW
jgi:hypothetical protein